MNYFGLDKKQVDEALAYYMLNSRDFLISPVEGRLVTRDNQVFFELRLYHDEVYNIEVDPKSYADMNIQDHKHSVQCLVSYLNNKENALIISIGTSEKEAGEKMTDRLREEFVKFKKYNSREKLAELLWNYQSEISLEA
ncbi:MAG: hypothetical protein ACOWWO_13445 [Peptococcaceae bacterium]